MSGLPEASGDVRLPIIVGLARLIWTPRRRERV